MVAETQTGTNTAQWHSGSKENAQASTESAVRSNKAVGSGILVKTVQTLLLCGMEYSHQSKSSKTTYTHSHHTTILQE